MAQINVWTYTKQHKDMVKVFAEVNNFATFERDIWDNRGNDHCMLTFKGSKGNLRVIAGYALALEHTLKNYINNSFLNIDMFE